MAGYGECVNNPRPFIILATCQVKIRGYDGQSIQVRALLDPGSELSFVTEESIRLLGVPRMHATIPLISIGEIYSGRTRGSVNVTLYSVIYSSVSYMLHAFILPRLTSQLSSFEVAMESWTHFRHLELADPNFGKPGPIHVIIGADVWSNH